MDRVGHVPWDGIDLRASDAVAGRLVRMIVVEGLLIFNRGRRAQAFCILARGARQVFR